MIDVAIVGAGITGLTCAFRLGQTTDMRVAVLERASRLGGKIATITCDDFRVETAANGFLSSRAETLALGEELGLEVLRASDSAKRRYTVRDGRLLAVPSGPGSFLKTPLLSLRGRLRVLLEPFVPRKRNDRHETIAEFASRRIGKEAAERLVDAAVTGILAGRSTQLSIAACFPKLVEMEREHGSLAKGMSALRKAAKQGQRASKMGGVLTSFHDGMGALVGAINKRLSDPVLLDSGVDSIRPSETGWILEVAGERLEASAVVVAAPAFVAGRLLRQCDAELTALLNRIDYAPMAVLGLGFERSRIGHALDGFGLVVPEVERGDILGCLFSSTVYPDRAPVGKALLRVMMGGSRSPDVLDLNDSQLVEKCLKYLSPLLDLRGAPEMTEVIRWPKAIPQYYPGHLDLVAALQTRLENLPGLFLAGAAYRGASINDCIRDASSASTSVLSYLKE